MINDGLSELNQMTEPNTFQRVRFLQQLALVSQLGGEMVTAQNFLSRAMKLALEDEEMDQVKLIELRIKQAEVNLALRDFDSARQILRHNVVDASEQLGREHYLTLSSEYLLGRYQIETGQFKRGEILLREILDRVGVEGRRQKQLRFDIEDHIAIGLSGQNNYLEAEKLHLSVLESKQAYYGDDHLETMNTLERLADTLQQSGQLLNASESFQRLVSVRSAQLPGGPS